MSLTIISGRKARYIQFRMWMRIATIAGRVTKNPVKIYNAVKRVRKLKKDFLSKKPLQKLIHVDKRYFWDLNQPGWPSKSFDKNFEWVIQRLVEDEKEDVESVRMVFLAITKKCPMNCEHCYEWDEINKKETMDLDTLNKIVAKYQKLGAAYFILGGGEPLVRYKDLVALLKAAEPTSDFWISTSGFNLTEAKAHELKAAGLTGVSLSIDHFDAEKNNKFRGHEQATAHIRMAAENALKAGLAVATAICATKEFITKDNMYAYADFSKNLGAGFIWLIEPRAAGRYEGKDVQLVKDQQDILDEFYITLNHDEKFLTYPRVIFPNYNHRAIGCAGAGTRSIMVDTDGYVNACPFCRKKGVHALAEDSREQVTELLNAGCPNPLFETRPS
jgi:MoaA/NifB/PqqE/SkfB family radical SAM enzyme